MISISRQHSQIVVKAVTLIPDVVEDMWGQLWSQSLLNADTVNIRATTDLLETQSWKVDSTRVLGKLTLTQIIDSYPHDQGGCTSPASSVFSPQFSQPPFPTCLSCTIHELEVSRSKILITEDYHHLLIVVNRTESAAISQLLTWESPRPSASGHTEVLLLSLLFKFPHQGRDFQYGNRAQSIYLKFHLPQLGKMVKPAEPAE